MAFSAIDSCDQNYIPRPLPRKTRVETAFCSRRLKKEEPHPGLQHCFGGNVIEEPLMLNVSVRPQPAAVAAVSALAATAGKTSSDEILIEQIAVGSKPAMQALFARHRTYVYRWLLRLVSNETLAEDLLSEVFLDVWRQAGQMGIHVLPEGFGRHAQSIHCR